MDNLLRKRLAGGHIIAGTFCILCGILNTVLAAKAFDQSETGYGIWLGFSMIIVGFVSLRSAQRELKCLVRLTIAVNLLSALAICPTLLIISTVSLGDLSQKKSDYVHYYANPLVFPDDKQGVSLFNSFLAVHSFMLIISVVEFVLANWTLHRACKIDKCSACNSQDSEDDPEIPETSPSASAPQTPQPQAAGHVNIAYDNDSPPSYEQAVSGVYTIS